MVLVVGDEGEIYVLDKQGKITIVQFDSTESSGVKSADTASTIHPPPIPVALPPLAAQKKRNGCLKGCMIAGASVTVLLLAGVLAIYLMAREYEKRPKTRQGIPLPLPGCNPDIPLSESSPGRIDNLGHYRREVPS